MIPNLISFDVSFQHVYVKDFCFVSYLDSVICCPIFSFTVNGLFHCISNLFFSVGRRIKTFSSASKILIFDFVKV